MGRRPTLVTPPGTVGDGSAALRSQLEPLERRGGSGSGTAGGRHASRAACTARGPVEKHAELWALWTFVLCEAHHAKQPRPASGECPAPSAYTGTDLLPRIQAPEFVYVLFASDLTGLIVESVPFPSKRRVQLCANGFSD